MNPPTSTRPVPDSARVDSQPRPAAYVATGTAAGKYAAERGLVAPRIGARLPGYGPCAAPAGMRAFPRHGHRADREIVYVIGGCGKLRIGDQIHAIRAGELIACPPGGAQTAHRIATTGTPI